MKLLISFFFAITWGSLCAAAGFAVKHTDTAQYPSYGFPNRVLVIELSGEIEQGDAVILNSVLDAFKFDPHHEFDRIVLSLNSEGGNLSEAIKIMDILKERIVQTYIGSQATCFSACAVVFMGGTSASVDSSFPSRTLQPGGRLGFHAPSLGITGTAQVPVSQLNSAYATALETLSELISRSAEREIRDSLFIELLATPPTEMRLVETVGDATRWGITIEYEGRRRPMNDADIVMACLLHKPYQSGVLPEHLHSELGRILGTSGVRKVDVTIYSETQKVAVVPVDDFSGESCGILGFEDGHGQIVYSYGNADSIAKTLETSNWNSQPVTQQFALDPALPIASLRPKQSDTLLDLGCPYAHQLVNARFDVTCKRP